MTVAATNTYEFTVRRLVYTAYRYAVLIPPGGELTPEQLTEGVDALERLVRELDSKGTRLRQTRYDTVTLTAGDRFVELGEDVFDVGALAMYIPADEDDLDQPSSSTPVERVYRDEIHGNSAKDATGPVTMFRLDKEQTPYRLELWPVPDEAGHLRIEAHRLAADSRDAATTPDLERHFHETLVNGVAWVLAKSNGVALDRVAMLRADYQYCLSQCMGQEKDAVDRQFKIGHRTGYRR